MNITPSKIHRLVNRKIGSLRRIRYDLLYERIYDPNKEFNRPHVFDPEITDRQIIHGFKYTNAIIRWIRDQGDSTLRVEYPLDSDSLVFDVGGFSGSWCNEIVRRYDCSVHIFEPINRFATGIAERFSENSKVHVHPFGLSKSDETVMMSVSGQGSSAFHRADNMESVQMRDICAFTEKLGIDNIDLVKINIEGGEYDLLPRMIECGLVERCQHLQIQFHEWTRLPDGRSARRERRRLRKQIGKTHTISFDYPFVWEGWTRR